MSPIDTGSRGGGTSAAPDPSAGVPTVTRLASGVRVVTETVPGVRSVALGLWVDVGSRDEDAGHDGASHFLEHLLFKGTGRRSAREIAETMDAVGGDMNAFTSKEVTCFHARVLDRDLATAFDVLADIVVDATNDPDDVETERDVVLSEIDAHNDAPDDLAHTDLAASLFGAHPLARETLGSEESIEGMERDRIHEHYLTHYRPEDLVVAAAGNLEHDRVVALADAMLGDLGRPGGATRTRTRPELYGADTVTVRTKPVEQAHVALGMPGLARDDADLPALAVLSTLLGGGMSSRLFQSIREQRGLAYSTFSYLASYSDGGMLGAYLGCAPERVDEALTALDVELARLPDDLGVAEVDRARASLIGHRILASEDTDGRMNRIGSRLTGGLPLRTIDEDIALYEAVTIDDVRRVIDRVLGGARVLAVVGPFAADDRGRFARLVGIAA